MRAKNVDLYNQIQEILAQQQKAQTDVDNLKAVIQAHRNTVNKSNRQKTNLENELKDMQAQVAQQAEEIKAKAKLLGNAQNVRSRFAIMDSPLACLLACSPGPSRCD